MFENGQIVFNETKGGWELVVTGKVFDDGTGKGKDFVNAVNSEWTSSTKQNGKLLTIRTNLSLTKDKKEASLTLKRCTDCKPSLLPNGGYTTNPGQAIRGGDTVWLMQDAGKETFVHEFGHILGLGHQLDKTNSIMSYSSNKAVKGSDVARLVTWYYGPYLDSKE